MGYSHDAEDILHIGAYGLCECVMEIGNSFALFSLHSSVVQREEKKVHEEIV